jgi:S-formylglutathione hydrolase FrmB
MKMVKTVPLAAALFAAFQAAAATVKTLQVPSAAMGRDIPVTVMLPDGYESSGDRRYPVVYMLHGAGDNHTTFADATGRKGVDEHGFIGVCPDGEKRSWWYDSPVKPRWKYETFVSSELVKWVDVNYRTIADRTGRAITGGSMGGHGACWIGFRHKDRFGAVGNIYGGVDVRRHTWGWKPWGLEECLGPYAADKGLWDRHMVVTEAEKLKNGDIELLTVVGTGDFFLKDNRALHEILARNKVAHLHLEVRGSDDTRSSHTHPFRRAAAETVFRFFAGYFATGKGEF